MTTVLLVETAGTPRPPKDALDAEHRVRNALALESVVADRRDGRRGAARDVRGGELALFGIPLGAAFLAAPLRARGHVVCHEPLVLRAAAGIDPAEALARAVVRDQPDVVGITVNHTVEEGAALRLAAAARAARPGVQVVLGGLHATIRAEALAARPEIDAVLRFEGEISLPAWLDHRDGRIGIDAVPGLVARTAGGLARTEPGAPVDFSRAMPDYDAVAADEYARAGILAHIQTARGCPWACEFCCHSAFWGRHVRFRDPGVVAEEAAGLVGRGCDLLYLTDSTFTLDRSRVRAIADAFTAHGVDRATFAVETRVDRLDDDVLADLARSGVRIVALGVETVSPEVLAGVRDKHQADPVKAVRQAVRRIRAHGMFTYASLVLGLPGETTASLQALVDTIDLLYADTDGLLWADAKLARVFPGTPWAADPARLHATVDARYELYDFYGAVTLHLETGARAGEILAARREIMERNVRAWHKRRPQDAPRVARAVRNWLGEREGVRHGA